MVIALGKSIRVKQNKIMEEKEKEHLIQMLLSSDESNHTPAEQILEGLGLIVFDILNRIPIRYATSTLVLTKKVFF